MTVSSSTSRVSYNGNGSTTVFAYTFRVFDQDDLTVIIRSANGTETVKTITTHYTVSGVGSAGGGNVTMLTAPASGETLVIIREQDLIQELDIVPNDPFPASSVEDALDKLTFMVQQHEETLGRTIKASRTNTISSTEFTVSAANRANKVFSFDASGDLSIAQEIGTFLGNWSASTPYKPRDLVKDTSTNNIFICVTAHTSSGAQPITTNVDSAKWVLIVDAAAAAASAAAAAASESAAASSASSASSSASAASVDATYIAEVAVNYLGAKTSDPTLDNEGNALIAGQLYFNSVSGDMRVYTGSAWSIAYLPATGYVTLTGTETLLNKTLNDLKISLGGTNGTTGQSLISQGPGLAPTWGSSSGIAQGFVTQSTGGNAPPGSSTPSDSIALI
jgi:hypothetical protein